MKNFDNIIARLEQVDSLVYAVETEMLKAEGVGEEFTRMQHLFYLLWEQVKQIAAEVDELSGHNLVCNAIEAVNHIAELKAEIERLKQSA